MIITIDGPSGTGKSTVSKLIADKLHFEHLDTGAFYRAFAVHIKEMGLDPLNESELNLSLSSFHIDIIEENNKKKYLLDKRDITHIMRTPEISQLSSKISVFPKVRKAIVSLQREYSSQKNIVAEGRDLGSVVFPKAQVKFFLTADPQIRAERRYEELKLKNPELDHLLSFEKTLAEIEERDRRDSERAISPLVCPEEAIIIDTNDLTIDQVVSTMIKIVEEELKPKKIVRSFFKRVFYNTTIYTFKLLFSIFYRIKVYGASNIGQSGGIIASNHVSFLDPPILACTAKTYVHFLARESLFRVPILKNLIKLLNTHPLKGGVGDLGVIKTVQSLIQKKQKIIMFPEGTRSEDGNLRPLKKGVANIIIRTGSTVYPVYIHGAYEIWDRKSKMPKLFGKVVVVYGRPISASNYALLERKQAQENLTHDLEKELHALKAWLLDGAEGPIP